MEVALFKAYFLFLHNFFLFSISCIMQSFIVNAICFVYDICMYMYVCYMLVCISVLKRATVNVYDDDFYV